MIYAQNPICKYHLKFTLDAPSTTVQTLSWKLLPKNNGKFLLTFPLSKHILHVLLSLCKML